MDPITLANQILATSDRLLTSPVERDAQLLLLLMQQGTAMLSSIPEGTSFSTQKKFAYLHGSVERAFDLFC